MSRSRFLRKNLGRPYLHINIWIWSHLPASLRSWLPIRRYSCHLHSLAQLRAIRVQSVATYFFRNRPELELLVHLLDQKCKNATLDLAVLACSKGAEVYTISFVIRSARPDLKVNIRAVDISDEILEFAKVGGYSLRSGEDLRAAGPGYLDVGREMAVSTSRDQLSSIFERMSAAEMAAMFDRELDQVRVKPRFREGITWHLEDAGDPALVSTLALQDIVVANRFLCHMHPDQAEACLRNLAQLVKPGGYLFVSGVDLDVRSKVFRELDWRPVTEKIVQIHDGDVSLRRGWPLQYWGLEPFDQGRSDWEIRYASVLQRPQRS